MTHSKTTPFAKVLLDILPPVTGVLRSFISQATKEKLTTQQYRILANIQRGQCFVGQIAEHHGISQPAISKSVAALVDKRLIERIPSKNDRRQIQLRLTSKGQQIFESIRSDILIQLNEQLETLSSEEKKQIETSLQLLKKILIDPKLKESP